MTRDVANFSIDLVETSLYRFRNFLKDHVRQVAAAPRRASRAMDLGSTMNRIDLGDFSDLWRRSAAFFGAIFCIGLSLLSARRNLEPKRAPSIVRTTQLAVFAVAGLIIFSVGIRAAYAADEVHDEIQVYNAEIAAVGQWTYEQHLNYAAIGQIQPEVPGGFSSNRALQGTPEFAYGLTNWWEAGFYLPFAVNSDGQFLSDGAKIRSLFVVPDAGKRSFFYGVNFELGYELPRFSLVPWNLEIRPIIGVRNKEWEFIINPIVDIGFGSNGEADFAPAARLARNLGEDRFIGLEYYADYGKIGSFLPLQQQSQQLFAVTDFKIDKIDVELGAGYGFTPGSDRFTLKAILGYAFPVPGSDSNSTPSPLKMGAPSRSLQSAWTQNPAN